MRLRNWYEVVRVDFPDIGEVTERTVKNIVEAARYGTGYTVREAMGRVWYSEDYEARRKRVLNTPLP